MDLETARILARTTTSTEIARQRATFMTLLMGPDTDDTERASLLEAIATLDEAARLQAL